MLEKKENRTINFVLITLILTLVVYAILNIYFLFSV